MGGVTADITPNTSTTSANAISLPKDSDGNIPKGTYTVTYNVIVTTLLGVDVADVTYSVSYVYDQDLPEVCLTADVNCQGATITSYDSTSYGSYATLSRVHILYPPPSVQQSPITGTQASLSSGSPIYDKTWTQEVESNVTYNLPNGLIVIVEVSGVREIPVVCDLGMTKIFCCLKKLFARYNGLQGINETKRQNMFVESIQPTIQNMVFYNAAVVAGDTNGAATYYAATIAASGCGDECGCESTEPQLIQPNIGSSNVTIVTSPDTSISVVPVVDGITTTYEIQLSAALQSIIANMTNVVVDTATPTYIEVTSASVGNTTTYTVNYRPSGALGYSLSTKRLSIDTSTTASSLSDYMEVTSSEVANIGGNIVTPASHLVYLGENVPNQDTDVALISVGNILVDATLPFNVDAKVMGKYSTTMTTSLSTIEAEVLYSDVTSGNIILRLVNPMTGQPYTLGELNASGFGTLYITLTINSQ
jgi:hypothetical protein